MFLGGRRRCEDDSRVCDDVDAKRDTRQAQVKLDLAREMRFGGLGFRGFDPCDGFRLGEGRLWLESRDDNWGAFEYFFPNG